MKPIIGILIFFSSFCTASRLTEIGTGAGMASVSFAEGQAAIAGENASEPSSGSLSVITTNLYWKLIPGDDYSYFVHGFFPAVASDGSSVLGAGGGVEYYFSQENNVIRENNGNFKLSVDPELRYYATGSVNLVYLAYLTETAKKNDINVELAAGAGAVYSIQKKLGLKADASVGRGVGVITSIISMRFFVSLVYYWDA